jgi:hypothetical protein
LDTPHLDLARRLADLFAPLAEVEAVGLGGSRGAGGIVFDDDSDIDVYVFTRGDVPLEARRAIVERAGGATRADLGVTFWGPGDEWFDRRTGIHVDVVYFDADWMAGQLDRVLVRHEASLGYSTCLWHTIRGLLPLHDRRGWLAALRAQAAADYPEELRRNIVALDHRVLRDALPAYAAQLAKAASRGDLVSVNHRLTGLLASYFDVLFAVNRLTHPGEKRLVEAAARTCAIVPAGMAADLEAILTTATIDLPGLAARVDRLLDRLDEVLATQGLLPPGRMPGTPG